MSSFGSVGLLGAKSLVLTKPFRCTKFSVIICCCSGEPAQILWCYPPAVPRSGYTKALCVAILPDNVTTTYAILSLFIYEQTQHCFYGHLLA